MKTTAQAHEGQDLSNPNENGSDYAKSNLMVILMLQVNIKHLEILGLRCFFSSTDVWLPASLLLKMLRWFGYKDCCKNKSWCTSRACFDFAGHVSDGGAGADGRSWGLLRRGPNIHSRVTPLLKTLQEFPMAPQTRIGSCRPPAPPAASPLAYWLLPATHTCTCCVVCLRVSPGPPARWLLFSLHPSGRLWPPPLMWGAFLQPPVAQADFLCFLLTLKWLFTFCLSHQKASAIKIGTLSVSLTHFVPSK